MLIGFELVRCLSDILERKIKYDDVLLVVTCIDYDFRQSADYNDFWRHIMDPIQMMYSAGRHNLHMHDKEEVHMLIDDLIYDGKLVKREQTYILDKISILDTHWFEVIPNVEHMTPAVKEAWEYFRMLEALCRNQN